MKTSVPIKKSIFLYLILIAFIATSCGSFQQTAYYSDGIYSNNQAYRQNTTVVQQPVQSSSQSYESYFAYKSQEYGTLTGQQDETLQEGEVFTDIDSYSSANIEGDVSINGELNYQGNGYAGWGDGVTNVSLIIAPVYGYHMNRFDWRWNNWYWNTGYWRSATYYGPSSWGYGWNNWGYYDPWAPNWGWNGFYGSSWGYGWNNWAGSYGFYCPTNYGTPYYGNTSSRSYVTNNTRRGYYTPSRSQNVSVNDYSSRRGYTRDSYSGQRTRTQSQGRRTKSNQDYSVKYSTPVKNTSRRNTNKNYSNTTRTRSNSSYNTRSSSTQRSSGSSYRSSTPSRSSGSSVRSSGSRSSRSSGGARRGGRE